ncbi:MAG TPA: hypothetical protein VF841_07790 [Anaeromyxobacter sp.]
MSWRDLESGIGRGAAVAASGAVVAGLAAAATGLGPAVAPRTTGALIASWLFFAGVVAGAAAFRAFFRIVDARWARPLAPLARLPAAFLPSAAVVLALILASAVRAPWVADARGWLGTRALVAREVAANAVLFALAWLVLRPGRGRSRALAVAYCLVYAVVLSIWAFDFVLGPDPVWGSTLAGPYVFMAAFLAGTGLVVFLGLALGVLGHRERRDAGALVFALGIFWAYLFWSQFLTLWYANLPDEIGFALRRAADGWGWVVLAVIGLVFVAPFVALLHPAGRRSPRFFGAIVAAQLAGLWLDFHLLVVPSLSPRGSPPLVWRDVLIGLGMLGAFVLSIAPAIGRELRARRPAAAPAPDAAAGAPVV